MLYSEKEDYQQSIANLEDQVAELRTALLVVKNAGEGQTGFHLTLNERRQINSALDLCLKEKSMTLDEFIATQKSRIEDFAKNWRKGQQGSDEETWPNDMSYGEWDEQLRSFDCDHLVGAS